MSAQPSDHSANRHSTDATRHGHDENESASKLGGNEAWIQTILDSVADGIITIDQRGTITSINASAIQMFGYAAEEIIGKNVSTLAPSPYREEHDGYLERYLRTGQAHIIGSERELVGQRRDGTIFPMALRVTETVYDDQRVFIGTVQDITPRKEIEAEKERLLDAIRAATAELSTASTDLLEITGRQAVGAQQQAASVSETVATVEDVTKIVEESTRRAKKVAESAQKADAVGKTGLQAVHESLDAMTHVQQYAQSISDNIAALAEQAHMIAKIIKSVNDIADQTNLLALNASIQAANAGEHGRTFAVVASEVKELSARAKESTAKIRQILEEIQHGIDAAVASTKQGTLSVAEANEVVQKTDTTIRALSDTITDSAQTASQILASARQQVSGMSQVQQAMGQIDLAANHTLQAAQQTKLTAENLAELGKRLTDLLGD